LAISYELRARVALEKYGFHNTYSLGQNFIFNEDLLSGLLMAAGVGKGDKVLEIGPGAGIMTSILAERCEKVVSIEIDQKLKPVLDEMLSDKDNSTIVYADAMKADIGAIIRDELGGGEVRVVANLPYYITSDVLMRLVAGGYGITDVCVMVQKEAADRLMSKKGDKQWCAVAAVMSYFGKVEIIDDVPRSCFEPAPHVDSAFMRIALYDEKPVQAASDEMMKKVINSAFRMRRKTLVNNLTGDFAISRQQAEEMLTGLGLDTRVRGEALELEQLAQIADAIYKLKETNT